MRNYTKKVHFPYNDAIMMSVRRVTPMFKQKTGLRIIIVGCGKVGRTLVEQLSAEGHNITVIDKDAEKVESMTNLFDVMGIIGNGASYSAQVEAGIESSDLIIAVTGSDELNLLCCVVAKQVGNCSAIARVRTPDYSREAGYLREQLGLTMIINPEEEAAREATHILSMPTALEVNSFAHGQAELVKIKIPEGNMCDGITLIDLSKKIESDFLVCGIIRGEEVYIPSGNFIIRKDDILSFVAPRRHVRNFLHEIGFNTNQVKNSMIIGGGRAAYYLAKQLINTGISVKIIECDKARCEELSILLPEAIIINGDGTNQELLKEEGIEYMDSFIPLTGIDEENIMLTLYCRTVSKAKVITKINRVNYKEVISGLDLGSLIYPKYITSEKILSYVRAKQNGNAAVNIETLYHILGQKAEAIEFRVNEESKVTEKTLAELTLKDNLLIASIYRKGKMIIPSGQDKIEVGDSVMVITTHTGFTNLQDILATR